MVRIVITIALLAVSLIGVQAQDDTQAALDAALRDFNTDDTALVVQVSTPDGDWTATSGLADGERPTEPDDRFRIGSMSKTFVAVTALMLAEEGVFALDDAARDWLPDELVEQIANLDSVSIRQLLAMRSGIPDYLGMTFWLAVQQDPTHEWTVNEALAYIHDQPALFEPDAQFSYSNSNYLLLQLILESATGQPLHTLVRERILDPLEMANTYTQISETLPGEFVNGYLDIDGDGKLDDVTDINDGAGMGDGALISTVGDLTTFYRALLQERSLLNEESMAELLSFQDADIEGRYSLGLAQWESDFGEALGHNGGVVGFVSAGVYLPEHQTIIIVLSGNMTHLPDELANTIAEIVLG
ncbi:MAG: beta-lactamase family protein [Anaerolineae bacterium]|nr:beta-lactamase family protein [Anaerolineae bacterium]